MILTTWMKVKLNTIKYTMKSNGTLNQRQNFKHKEYNTNRNLWIHIYKAHYGNNINNFLKNNSVHINKARSANIQGKCEFKKVFEINDYQTAKGGS